MLIVHSHNGVPTRLTAERWQHIMQRHPDMETQRERILETLTELDRTPDTVWQLLSQLSDFIGIKNRHCEL